MFKRILNRLLDSPALCIFCFVVYVTLLGPLLISAASTVFVLIGLVLFGLLVGWAYSRFLKGAFK